jgi:hypothetical protein
MRVDRHYEASWFGVIDMLEEDARSRYDGMSLGFAHLMADIVDVHYNGPEGCPECAGQYDALDCPRWEDAQRIMLGWLIQKAAGR